MAMQNRLSEYLNNLKPPRIRSMGLTMFDPVWAQKEHVAHNAELLHVERGQLREVIGENSWSVQPGDTILIPPNQRHRDDFDVEEGLDVFLCQFEWPDSDAYWAMVPPNVFQEAARDIKAEVTSHINYLQYDLTTASGVEPYISSGRLLTILMLALKVMKEGDKEDADNEKQSISPREDLVNRAKKYLEDNVSEPLSLDDVAIALNVSPYHLSHVFSQEADFTLVAYLTRLRMQKAREMLLANRYTITEVANAVGYEDRNYFSRVFRKHHGVAPSDFVNANATP